MGPKAMDVMEQARTLSEEERRELAIELLDSAIEPEIQRAWIEQARQRLTEVDSGQVATHSNEQALRLVDTDH